MKNNPFRVAVFFGILLFLTGVLILFFNPLPQNNLPKGFYSSILAFEFIHTNAEVIRFFEVNELPDYLYKFNMVNAIDYFFMVFYSLFLTSFSFAVFKITKTKWMFVAMFFSLLAWPSDLFENIQIGKIANNIYGNNDQSLYLLNIFTWIKWGSIASSLIIISNYFMQKLFFNMLVFSCSILAFIFCCISFFHRSIANELMGLFVMLSFLLLFIYSIAYKKFS